MFLRLGEQILRIRMINIADWLEQYGLGKYAKVFAENDVDLEALPELTDDELKELGVSLGHRKKLLKAIGQLDQSQADPEFRSDRSPSLKIKGEAEHRQLTVMFSDLVDSTRLAQKLDPEDLRTVINVVQDAWKSAIERYEGFVARYMGDGVLAYFGYPQAHEDDAERAVRTGLAIVDAMHEVNTQVAQYGELDLTVRIGIATGPVVVGDLVGEGTSEESPVLGETPNLAARLQDIAEPNSVNISTGTHHLTGGQFRYEELGEKILKGIEEPVCVWKVVSETEVESRFAALHGAQLTNLVGREEELDLLLSRWRRAREGDGQLILLSGEPGLGKSRLTEALTERIADEEHIRVRFFCSPYHTTSALYPVISQVRRGAGISPNDSPETKLDKVEALLRRGADDIGTQAPLISALLSIPYEKQYPKLQLTPQAQRANTLETLIEHLKGLCSTQPILMVLEDKHWADPTTIELFGLLIDRLRELPILLLVTFRPEYEPTWRGHGTPVTSLTLNRMGRDEGKKMVEQMTGGKRLPDELLDQILVKTDGIPLFVEELTKSILESGQLTEREDEYELNGSLPSLAIPTTLQDSLMARLDRLASAKEVAQVGSVIGRRFSHKLLALLTSAHEDELAQALTHLVDSELIFREGSPPDSIYIFKHALVQDTAYQSLLRSRRQELHAKIAEALEESFPYTVEQQPEVLAHHLTEGNQPDKAVAYWEQAGQLAMASSANQEARRHFNRGLEVVGLLPESIERKEREIRLQTGLAGALINVEGLAAKDLEGTYIRARDLCEQVGATKQHFIVEWGLWHVYIGRSEWHRARELADELLGKAEGQEDSDLLLQSYHADWSVLTLGGRSKEAVKRCEQGWQLYDRERHASHAFVFGGHDPGVCSRNMGAWTLWQLGYADAARSCHEQGLALARTIGHPVVVAHAYNWGATLHEFCGDHDKMRMLAQAALDLATEQSLANYYTDATILKGWLIAQAGEPEEGIRVASEALSEREARGTIYIQPYYLSLLAHANAAAGNLDEAMRLITQAIEQADRGGEAWIEADLYRTKGDLLRQSGNDTAAEDCFLKAIVIAQQRHTKAYELRAAKSLAHLWQQQTKVREAKELLTPIYNWFTEGFETTDLKEAKALLDELS